MNQPAKRPKNWLLMKMREYHTWLGVALSLFVLVICVTGIYLNHKDVFRFGEGAKHKEKATGRLTTSTQVASLKLTVDEALAKAKEEWGDAGVERIELRETYGKLVYKIKRLGGGGEVMLDAESGTWLAKTEYERAGGGWNWGKILNDLHTGKIAGTTGKLLVDFTSVVIIVLTVTGIYLWAVPLIRKRRSALERAQAASAKTNANPSARTAGSDKKLEPETTAVPV